MTGAGSGSAVGPGRVVYASAPATAVWGIGVGSLGLGTVLLLAVGLAAVDPPTWLAVALGVLLGLAAFVLLVLLGTALGRLLGRGPRLVVDAEGFRNHAGLRVGVRRASWRQVKHVKAVDRTLVIELDDGRQSLVDSSLLAVAPPDLADDLRARLNTARGYRPL